MIKRLVLYIVAVLYLGVCWSQEKFPVAVNAQLIAPYSLYLDDYTSEYKERIGIVLLNRDTYYPSMEVKLRFTIKSNGLVLTSNPYGRYQPILLDAGVPYSLKGAELTQYFLPQNLQASGLGSGSFNQGAGGSNRKLPEGMVEFNIEVLEFYSGKVISLPAKALAWVSTHRPPLLTQPLNNQEISFRDPLNVLFQWTPLHSGLANVKYELIIKQLWDNGLRPEAAWLYSPEVFREPITPTSLMYGAAMPPLLSGLRYAWAVRAYVEDDGGEVQVFENNGLSEIFTFSLEEHCPPPYNITATPDRGKLKLSWIPLPEHSGFTVSYRVQGSSEWFETACEENQITLYDVRAGFSYEYRVGSACNSGKIIYNPSAFIKLAEASPNENCGLQGLVDTDNKTPLPALASGDIFLASDYPVYVTEASGSNGVFSGKGYTIMPSMFAKAKMAVTFDGIGINTDRKLVSGSVKAVYNESQSQIANIDEILEGGDNVGKIQKGITKAAVDLSFTIPDNATLSMKGDEITIQDAQGQTVGSFTIPEEVKNNGASIFPISVKDKDGNIYTIDAPVDPETGLADTSNLQIDKAGKEGKPLSEGSVNFNKFDSKLAWVSFIPSGKYALDRWSKDYQMNDLLNNNYQARDTSIAYKLIPAGRSDRVDFHLRLEDPKIDPTKIIFKTSKGTEFTSKAGDNGVYSLQLPAAEAEDGYELYALYPNGSKYYNFGKLVVVSYPEKTIKLNIVPVNGTQVSKDNLSRELNAIYNPVGISLKVEVLPNFEYQGDKGFMEKGSGLLSVYTPAMRELQTAYGAVENDAAYLFYIKGGNGANRMDRDAAAFMPHNKQFAYLFGDNYPDLTLAAPVVAHELGHGVLSLQHTFDYKIPVRTTENLMDYKGGTRIAKWQWDRMYDPGVVIGLFEKDEDAMFAKENWAVEINGFIYECLSKDVIKTMISGKEYTIPIKKINFFQKEDLIIDLTIGQLHTKGGEQKIRISKDIQSIKQGSKEIWKTGDNFPIKVSLSDNRKIELDISFTYTEGNNIYSDLRFGIEFIGITPTLKTFDTKKELINIIDKNHGDPHFYGFQDINLVTDLGWGNDDAINDIIIKWNNTTVEGKTNNNYILNEGENTFEFIPKLGDKITYKLHSSPETPTVMINNKYGGTCFIDNYEDYKNYDQRTTKNGNDYEKLKIDGNDYYVPRLNFYDNTELNFQISLSSKKQGENVYYRYIIESLGNKDTVLIEQIMSASMFSLTPTTNSSILIKDGFGKEKGVLSLVDINKEYPEKQTYSTKIFCLKFKNKKSSETREKVMEGLNDIFKQANIMFESEGEIHEIELSEDKIPLSFKSNGITYSKARAITLLNLENVSIADDKDYTNVILYVRDKILQEKLKLNNKEKGILLLNTVFETKDGYAYTGEPLVFIPKSFSQKTVAHELCHSLGLGDFGKDLNSCTDEEVRNSTCHVQSKSDNLMAYKNGIVLTKWQIAIIRLKYTEK